MKKEFSKMVKETVSKVAVGAALKTVQMPNQCCPLFFGEPHSKLEIKSKDYHELATILKKGI